MLLAIGCNEAGDTGAKSGDAMHGDPRLRYGYSNGSASSSAIAGGITTREIAPSYICDLTSEIHSWGAGTYGLILSHFY